MIKSGLILAVVALLLSIGSSILISPLCVPCIGLVLGLVAGYLACVFDNPSENGEAVKSGALAGAIGGAGALLGQIIGAGINAVLVGPEQSWKLLSDWGMDPGNLDAFASTYWLSTVGINCCSGLLDVALMAGLGALGAVLWYQFANN